MVRHPHPAAVAQVLMSAACVRMATGANSSNMNCHCGSRVPKNTASELLMSVRACRYCHACSLSCSWMISRSIMRLRASENSLSPYWPNSSVIRVRIFGQSSAASAFAMGRYRSAGGMSERIAYMASRSRACVSS